MFSFLSNIIKNEPPIGVEAEGTYSLFKLLETTVSDDPAGYSSCPYNLGLF
jgi:hypothetical protein